MRIQVLRDCGANGKRLEVTDPPKPVNVDDKDGKLLIAYGKAKLWGDEDKELTPREEARAKAEAEAKARIEADAAAKAKAEAAKAEAGDK